MKILVMGFTKLKYMPYANMYLEPLSHEPCELHLLVWNRDLGGDIACVNAVTVHEFKCAQLDEVPKSKKIQSFRKYRSFAKQVIQQGAFDRIIVLHTLPAVLLADVLLKHYKEKFILDYRDYTYEGFTPFRKIVGKLVQASYATFASSDAFRCVLPKLDKVYTSHNLLTDSLKHRNVRSDLNRKQMPIRIAFWGFIRHEELNKKLIHALGNDKRFELHYYGREQKTALDLKRLVAEKNYTNVFFHGAYLPEDRYTFASQTDLIHNMYENDAQMKKAMANKYYDGIVLRIPQLCTKDSFMGQRVTKEKVGLEVDPNFENLGDQLQAYYTSINWDCFEKACDFATEIVVNEYKQGIEKIQRFAADGQN